MRWIGCFLVNFGTACAKEVSESSMGRVYIEIPGSKTHELPPLLVRPAPEGTDLAIVMDRAGEIVESEDMLPDVADTPAAEQRKYDLAINLTEHYVRLLAHWQWGDSILEWIRQCEITFETEDTLRSLLHPDVWPHASRSSFVTLLVDKDVHAPVSLENAVGMRLTFRQPPPIDCFSNQFLFYLNSPVAGTAYQTWAHMSSGAVTLLPPERFHFQVISYQ
jgi:hypothetical protein